LAKEGQDKGVGTMFLGTILRAHVPFISSCEMTISEKRTILEIGVAVITSIGQRFKKQQ
jgi:hypothetical protein